MLTDEEFPEVAKCLMSGGDRSCARVKSWIKRPMRLEEWMLRSLEDDRLDDVREIFVAFHSCKATLWQDKVFALIGETEIWGY
jgi:hypothetical protein